MLIKQDFEAAQSVDTVWDFFGGHPTGGSVPIGRGVDRRDR